MRGGGRGEEKIERGMEGAKGREGQRRGGREHGRRRRYEGGGGEQQSVIVPVIVLSVTHRKNCSVTLYGWPTDGTLKITTLSTLRRLDLLLA